MFRFRALSALKRRKPEPFLAFRQPARRAAAPINGLLSVGRNRKMAIANPLRSEHAGAAWTSPENHL
jgi:hypothetical protein